VTQGERDIQLHRKKRRSSCSEINEFGVTERVAAGCLPSISDTSWQVEKLKAEVTASADSITKGALVALMEKLNFFLLIVFNTHGSHIEYITV
jgi:hypothetical protein